MSKDYYNILGVSKNSSAEDIKKAYRKLAHQYHPDKGNGNADRFKEVNEAYQVLGDQNKRQQYDQFGTTFNQTGGFSGGAGPGSAWDFGGFQQSEGFDFDLGDIFGDLFGGQRQRAARQNRGIDLEMGLKITFEEAVFGLEKNISLEKRDVCKTCSGSGAEPGSKVITCPKCHGQGQIRTQRRTIFGTIASSVSCDRCEGTGKVPEKPCHTCGGSGSLRQEKTIAVTIPAGIDNGQRIRIAGEGEAGYRGSSPGDLFLIITVSPHKEFVRDGFNLLKDLPVSFTQATLGAKVHVRTLDGEIELKVPAGTQSGTVMKVKNHGVPNLDNPSRRGDLLITIRVIVPKKLTRKEKELLKTLAEERGESVEIGEGLWGDIKNSLS
jgi:molecular chaperone DnaJ